MQIVVPAAGRGQRFIDKGYLEPKPLIKVLNKPLIKWSTDGLQGVDDLKFIFLVQEEHIVKNQIDVKLREEYGDCEVVSVKEVTEGAACTVLLAKDKLNMDEDMAIVNCDNLFVIDLGFAKKRLMPETKGAIFYFASLYDHWSYVETDANGFAKRVVEKEVISDKATVGCYYFSKARYFVEAAEYMIRENMRTKGEFYVAPTYNLLIEQGALIQTFPSDLHMGLGTPQEVDRFLSIFSSQTEKVKQSHEATVY